MADKKTVLIAGHISFSFRIKVSATPEEAARLLDEKDSAAEDAVDMHMDEIMDQINGDDIEINDVREVTP